MEHDILTFNFYSARRLQDERSADSSALASQHGNQATDSTIGESL